MKFSDFGIYLNNTGTPQQKVMCPECTPSRKKQNLKDLSVNVAEGSWFCHHCGWNGGLGIREVMPMKKTYVLPESRATKITPEVLAWFEARCIPKNVVQWAEVSAEQAWMPQTGKEESCVVFPYFINGKLINRKYRDGRKNMRTDKDARLVMYCPVKNGTRDPVDTIYITEGEPDCLTCYALNYRNVVSIPNGAPAENVDLETYDFSYLPSLNEIFESYKKVVLVMDTDKVGSKVRDELARRLGYEITSKVEYPEDCKDINEVLVKYGEEKAKECIDNAAAYPVKGLYGAEDFTESLVEYYEKGFESGVLTGWHSVDRIYTPRPKEFTVVTGIPSHGKSGWLDNLMVNIADRYKWKFAIFSPENAPCERHLANLTEIIVGKPFSKGYRGHMSKEEMIEAQTILNKYFYFLMPIKDDFSMDDILKLAKAAIFKYGVKGIIIDPWNEIEHNRGTMSETDYISKSLSKVRYFSRINDVHTWIVAHPTKLYKDKTTGKYPVPTPYDISGSGHWRNKADNCICVHRHMEENYTSVNSQKIRFKECGQLGEAKLNFDIKNSRFTEMK